MWHSTTGERIFATLAHGSSISRPRPGCSYYECLQQLDFAQLTGATNNDTNTYNL